MFRRKMANARFQKGTSEKENKLTTKELLKHNQITILIAEFVIFIRLTTLFSSYANTLDDPEISIAVQDRYYRESLIKEISNLSICKQNKWQPNRIEKIISTLLEQVKLSKQKSDEWALQYLSHFFSSHSIYQLVFYNTFFFEIHKKAYKAMITQENSISGVKARFSGYYKNGRQISKERKEILSKLSVPDEIINLYSNQIIFLGMGILGIFFLLTKSLPPVFDEPILQMFFKIILNLVLFMTIGRNIISHLLYSPISWKEAGIVFQISLMEEITEIMPFRESMSIARSCNLKPAAVAATADTVLRDSPPIALSVMPPVEETIALKKRKIRPSILQFFSFKKDEPTRVKVVWEDPNIKPLHGIVTIKNHKPDIDFMPSQGISRAWSMKPNVHSSCKNHLFFQLEQGVIQDPVYQEHCKIISVAHVVPSEEHPGLVCLQKGEDTNFPGARYKAKSLSKNAARWRTGLFPMTRSKEIIVEGNPNQPLPRGLQDKVFILHIAGPPKRTH